MTGQRLPSFKTLKTFATAARLENFKAAASELHVSPSAISHQIKVLEDWLGVRLFERTTRQVSITPAGARLSRKLQRQFQAIDDSLQGARAKFTERTLRISALPLFTDTWLLPKLASFEANHPGINIELDTLNRVADLDTDNIDIGIRNTRIRQPGLVHKKLIDLQVVPLCSPELASTLTPKGLLQQTLIVHGGRPDGWRWWLRQQGVDAWPPKKLLTLDTIGSAITAASRGTGVLQGLAPFIWETPGIEQLHNPVNAPLISGGSYTLVYRKKDQSTPQIKAFADWLQAELKTDYHRLISLGSPMP